MLILFSAELPESSDQLPRRRQTAQVSMGLHCMTWDVGSGISVTKSKQGAIKHAVNKLIDALKAEGFVSWKLSSL